MWAREGIIAPVCIYVNLGAFLNEIMRNEYEIVYDIVNQIYIVSFSNRLPFFCVLFYTFQCFTFSSHTRATKNFKNDYLAFKYYIAFEVLHFVWNFFLPQFHPESGNCLFIFVIYLWFGTTYTCIYTGHIFWRCYKIEHVFSCAIKCSLEIIGLFGFLTRCLKLIDSINSQLYIINQSQLYRRRRLLQSRFINKLST